MYVCSVYVYMDMECVVLVFPYTLWWIADICLPVQWVWFEQWVWSDR